MFWMFSLFLLSLALGSYVLDAAEVQTCTRNANCANTFDFCPPGKETASPSTSIGHCCSSNKKWVEGRCPTEPTKCPSSGDCGTSQECNSRGFCCTSDAENDANCDTCGIVSGSGLYRSRPYNGGCTLCSSLTYPSHYPTRSGCLKRKVAGATCNLNGPDHVIEWSANNNECEQGSHCKTRCCVKNVHSFCTECGTQGECTRCKQGYRLNGDACEEIKAVAGAVCDKDSVCESGMCRNKACCHSGMSPYKIPYFNSAACSSCAPLATATPTTTGSTMGSTIGIWLLTTTVPSINLDGVFIGGLATTTNPSANFGTTAANVKAGYCNACSHEFQFYSTYGSQPGERCFPKSSTLDPGDICYSSSGYLQSLADGWCKGANTICRKDICCTAAASKDNNCAECSSYGGGCESCKPGFQKDTEGVCVLITSTSTPSTATVAPTTTVEANAMATTPVPDTTATPSTMSPSVSAVAITPDPSTTPDTTTPRTTTDPCAGKSDMFSADICADYGFCDDSTTQSCDLACCLKKHTPTTTTTTTEAFPKEVDVDESENDWGLYSTEPNLRTWFAFSIVLMVLNWIVQC